MTHLPTRPIAIFIVACVVIGVIAGVIAQQPDWIWLSVVALVFVILVWLRGYIRSKK